MLKIPFARTEQCVINQAIYLLMIQKIARDFAHRFPQLRRPPFQLQVHEN